MTSTTILFDNNKNVNNYLEVLGGIARQEQYSVQGIELVTKGGKCSKIVMSIIGVAENESFRKGVFNTATEEKVLMYQHKISSIDNNGESVQIVGQALGELYINSEKAVDSAVYVTCRDKDITRLINEELILFKDPLMFVDGNVNGSLKQGFNGVNAAFLTPGRKEEWNTIVNTGNKKNAYGETTIEAISKNLILRCSLFIYSPSGMKGCKYMAIKIKNNETKADLNARKESLYNAISAGAYSINKNKTRDYKTLVKDSGRFGMSLVGNKCLGEISSFVVHCKAFKALSVSSKEESIQVEGLDGGASCTAAAMINMLSEKLGVVVPVDNSAIGKIFFQGRTFGGMTKFAMSVQADGYIKAVVENTTAKVVFVKDRNALNGVMKENFGKEVFIIYGMTKEEFEAGKEPAFLFDKNNVKLLPDFNHEDAFKLYMMQVGHEKSEGHTSSQTTACMFAESEDFREYCKELLMRSVDDAYKNYVREEDIDVIDPTKYVNDNFSMLAKDSGINLANIKKERHGALRKIMQKILSRKRFNIKGAYLHSAGDPTIPFMKTPVLMEGEVYSPSLTGKEVDIIRHPKCAPGEHVVARCVSLADIKKRVSLRVDNGEISAEVADIIVKTFKMKGDAYLIIPNTDRFKNLTGGSDNDWDGFLVVSEKRYVKIAKSIKPVAVFYDNDKADSLVDKNKKWNCLSADNFVEIYMAQAFSDSDSVGIIANRTSKFLSIVSCTDDKMVLNAMEKSFGIEPLNEEDKALKNEYIRQITNDIEITKEVTDKLQMLFINSDRSAQSFRNYCMDMVYAMVAVQGITIDAEKNGTRPMELWNTIDDDEAEKEGRALYTQSLLRIKFIETVSSDTAAEDTVTVKAAYCRCRQLGKPNFIFIRDGLAEMLFEVAKMAAKVLTADLAVESGIKCKELVKRINIANAQVDRINISKLSYYLNDLRNAVLPASVKAQYRKYVVNTMLYCMAADARENYLDRFSCALSMSYNKKKGGFNGLWTVFQNEMLLSAAYYGGKEDMLSGAEFCPMPSVEVNEGDTVEFINGISELGFAKAKLNGSYTVQIINGRLFAVKSIQEEFAVEKLSNSVVLPISQSELDAKGIALLEEARANKDSYTGLVVCRGRNAYLDFFNKTEKGISAVGSILLDLSVTVYKNGSNDYFVQSMKDKWIKVDEVIKLLTYGEKAIENHVMVVVNIAGERANKNQTIAKVEVRKVAKEEVENIVPVLDHVDRMAAIVNVERKDIEEAIVSAKAGDKDRLTSFLDSMDAELKKEVSQDSNDEFYDIVADDEYDY